MKDDKKFQFYDHFSESPFVSSSRGTTPERASSLSEPTSSYLSPSSSSSEVHSPISVPDDKDSMVLARKKFDKKKTRTYVHRIREHVKMGPKLSETVKGKLSVGAKIIQNGGRENIFKHVFGVNDGEKLLKASQCYLSTTTGPIAGILFISTQKVAFCSERPISLPSPLGLHVMRTPYKVIIPVKKIKTANESLNVQKPTQKYIQIVTEDNFEFWLMGFVRYERAFMNLQKAISMYK